MVVYYSMKVTVGGTFDGAHACMCYILLMVGICLSLSPLKILVLLYSSSNYSRFAPKRESIAYGASLYLCH